MCCIATRRKNSRGMRSNDKWLIILVSSAEAIYRNVITKLVATDETALPSEIGRAARHAARREIKIRLLAP